jgi:hypothetical protein
MCRRNRLTPFGEIIVTPDRGTFMGNRGLLHDENGNIRLAWRLKRWLLCVLEFRGRRRQVMAPGRYTELFFLDEATGLAAGHRPCWECCRDRYLALSNAWSAGRVPAEAIDGQLHAERLDPDGSQHRFEASLDDLPGGVFITRRQPVERAYLVWKDRLLVWSPGAIGTGSRGRKGSGWRC